MLCEITKQLRLTQSKVEDLNNQLKQIGNDKVWFEWVDRFGDDIRSKKDVPDPKKKSILQHVLQNIVVDYNHEKKVHVLTINFKIPVVLYGDVGSNRFGDVAEVEVTPPRSGRKSNHPISNYSTVMNVFPFPTENTTHRHHQLKLSVQLLSSNLWTSPYSPYQQKLFNIISQKHEEDGLNFKEISDWLNENSYLTPRRKIFKQNHVWSIYKKKQRSIERFSREFTPDITNIEVNSLEPTLI